MLKNMDVDLDDDVKSNPLKEKRIVGRVLSFLPASEIKRMRLVSQLLSKEGAKQLVKKCYIRPTSCLPKKKVKEVAKLQAIKKFSQFLKLSRSTKYLKVVCERIDCSNMIEIIKEVPNLRSRAQELKFAGGVSSSIKDLAQLMNKLPFVDILHTSTLNLNPSQFEDKNKTKKNDNTNNSNNNDKDDDANNSSLDENKENDDDGDSSDILDTFLDKLKDLSELHLDHFIRTDVELGDYLTHRKKLTALKRLSLITTTTGSNGNIQREPTFLSSKCECFHITHLNWNLDRKISKGIVHKFVLNFADTLTNLSITIGKEQEDAIPWTDDWYIPYNLPKLKTIELDGHSEHVKSAIFISLQLKSLEKLVAKNAMLHILIHGWESHVLANQRKLCSQTIKEVELDKIDYYNMELLDGVFWPNVKSVKVNIILLHPRWISYKKMPFENSKNIEHLEFDLSEVPAKNFHSYEKWMTGANCSNLYESGTIVAKTVDYFCLRDLTSLKSLTITGAGFIGDFFIYNFFQELRSLQSLNLQGARISAKAYEDLKERLNPTTSIIITN